MKARPLILAATFSGATLGGWVGYGTGIGHVAYNGQDFKRAYDDVVSMNLLKKEYRPILVHYTAGNILGALAGAALAYRKLREC